MTPVRDFQEEQPDVETQATEQQPPVEAKATEAQPPAETQEVPQQQPASAPPTFTKTKTAIDWRILTKEHLKACIKLGALTENKKKNPKASGQTIWLRWNNREFKKFFPDHKYKLSNDRLVIKTPWMVMPFGISEFNGKFSVPFGFTQDEEVEDFEDWCSDVFDAAMVELIEENSEKWLGKKYNQEMIKEMYLGLRKHSEDDKEKGYDPKTCGFKILGPNISPQLKATHGKGNPIDIYPDDVKEKVLSDEGYLRRWWGTSKAELTSFWINRPRCGVSFTLGKLDVRTEQEMQNPGKVVNDPEPAQAGGEQE